MGFKIGDIVRVEEPVSFQPHLWNRTFKIVEDNHIRFSYIESQKEYGWHPWLVVEVMGEPIRVRGRRYGVGDDDIEIIKFEITEEGQKDLILVKREEEIIPMNIKKHKI